MFNLSPFLVHVDFPALDRLVSYLEANQQKQIDLAVERLKVSNAGLHGSVAANQPK